MNYKEKIEIMKRAQELLEVDKEESTEVEETFPATPVRIIASRNVIEEKVDNAIEAVLDAKPPAKIKMELEEADIEKWSRVFARVYAKKTVKIDANITAMGILALFPVAEEM